MADEIEIDPLLTLHELRPLGIRFTKQWVDKLEKRGEFPRRVRISARTIAWRKSEIKAFLEAKAAERAA
jgi:predicted DNA-binding transcriptional regulator AlpA